MYSDLKGKVAIVTGVANPLGIGRAIAKTLIESSVNVICTDIADDQLQDAVKAIGGLAVQANITDQAAVKALMRHAIERFARLDILVNNAAMFHSGTALEITMKDFDRVLDVNLRGTFMCSQMAARVMMESDGGAIVNVSSLSGQLAFRGMAAYSASKGGVDALTRALAADWAPKIRVNAVAPGHVATARNLVRWHQSSTYQQQFKEHVLMRKLGETPDVAHAVAFLASDQSRYMTGQIINLDGGLSAWQGPLWP